jgi:hypothetical protein
LQLNGFIIGNRLGAADEFQLYVLSKVLKQAKISGVGLLSVDVTIAADVTAETEDGYIVELGDDLNLEDKFTLLMTSMDELSATGKTGGIIDVASAASAYYREK